MFNHTSLSRLIYSVPMMLLPAWLLALGAVLLWPALVLHADGGTIVPGGTISTNTTWTTAGSPYIVQGGLTINAGVTLTVQPDVAMRFVSGAGLNVNGTLIADGTTSQPITFTSSMTTPQRGDWQGVTINAGGRARLSYCDIGYGGGNTANRQPMLWVYASDVVVQNCRIHESVSTAVLVEAGIAPRLANLSIVNNSGSAILERSVDTQAVYSNLVLSGNGANAIVILTSALARDRLLPNPGNGVPYLLGPGPYYPGYVTVQSGGVLTVQPGVELQFVSGSGLQVNGTLIAEGTATQPITFTSSMTTPQRGDWQGLVINAGAKARLAYCDLGYAGPDVPGHPPALWLYASDVVVQNCRIHDNGNIGVLVESGSSPTLANVALVNNGSAAVYERTIDTQATYVNLLMSGNGTNAVVIQASDLARNRTLPNPSVPYVLGPGPYGLGYVTIDVGGTLTITPGTILQFVSGVRLYVNGALIAEGTPTQPITFTSVMTTPSRGDWADIEINDGARARLAYCDIGYGGQASIGQELLISSSDVVVRNCTLHDSAVHGMQMYAFTNITPTVENVTIADNNAWAIAHREGEISPIYRNVVLANNGYNGLVICCNTGTAISGNATWTLVGYPTVVGGNATIKAGVTLTINPGVNVQFVSGRSLIVAANGTLNAIGTPAQPITFTAYLTAPRPGDWFGIEVNGAAHLENCVVQYAQYGVTFSGASANQQLIQCQFLRNSQAGVRLNNASPYFAGNQFVGNGAFGLNNTTPSVLVDARNQWWGHSSGPYHATRNPTGLGDRVSDGVLFDPWLQKSSNSPSVARLLSPSNGATFSDLPVVLQMSAEDPDTWQRLYFKVEIISGTQVIATYDQRSSALGWDRPYYAPGMTATLTLRDALPNGAYSWRVSVFDGFGLYLAAETRTFAINIAGMALALAQPDQLIATVNQTQTLLLNGVNFNASSLQVWLEQQGQRLDAVRVQVQSSSVVSVQVNFTGYSGPWEVVASQGGVSKRTRVYVFPYMPVISIQYENSSLFTPGRVWSHRLRFNNYGTAPGVALAAVLVPTGTQVTNVIADVGGKYLGQAAPWLHLIAQPVAPGETRYVSLSYLLPWSLVNPPGQSDPNKYTLGAPLRFNATLIGEPLPEVWTVIQPASTLDELVSGADYASSFIGGLAFDQYLAITRTLGLDYVGRLSAAYPFVADALLNAELTDFHFALSTAADQTRTPTLTPQRPTQFSWDGVKQFVFDVGNGLKQTFTEGNSPVQSSDTAVFLTGELEVLTGAPLTMGFWHPNLGADWLASCLGVSPGTVRLGRQTGSILSIAEPSIANPVFKWGGKKVGHWVVKLGEKWNYPPPAASGNIRATLGLGNKAEPIRFGWSRVENGVDNNVVHAGIGQQGPHVAFGTTNRPVIVNGQPLVGPNGEVAMEANVHMYFDRWYSPRTGEIQAFAPLQVAQGSNALRKNFARMPNDTNPCNSGTVSLRASYDPNELESTPARSHIRTDQPLHVMVRFENSASANLAAQNVTVTLPIDPNLDFDSAVLEDVSHPSVYAVRADSLSRTITWVFANINLPPNQNPPQGEGWVRFSLSPRSDLVSGNLIRMKARILFDENPPIDTNEVQYVMDVSPPQSTITASQAVGNRVTVNLQAADNAGGVGLAAVSLLVSQDGTLWSQADVLTTTVPMTGTLSGMLTFSGSGSYWLATSAVDALGNTESVTTTNAIRVSLPFLLYLPVVER